MEGAELGKRSATSELRREKHMKSTGKGEKLPRDKKAPVGGDDDVYVIDEFDSTKPIDMEKDICAMCKEGHDFGLLLKKIMPQVSHTGPVTIDDDGDEIVLSTKDFMDPTEVWVSRYGFKTRRAFVHFYCAVASPRVWFTGADWRNVLREVKRSAQLPCRDCGKRGATIGCLVDRCSVVMHLPCALKNGYRQLRYEMNFLCPDHRREAEQKVDRSKQDLMKQRGNDISRGLENIPITYTNLYDTVTPLDPLPASLIPTSMASFPAGPPAFEYVVENLDSDEIITNARNVDDVDYCTCDDMCDDMNGGCSCISNGPNYTNQGLLIPGRDPSRKILECNFKCACSYRRCANRVVERGLNFHLQVFRTRDEQRAALDWTGASSSGTASKKTSTGWGVRTLDFIPRYAFVCEVMGQFRSLRAIQRSSPNNDTDVPSSAGKKKSRKSGASAPSSSTSVDWAVMHRRIRVSKWDQGDLAIAPATSASPAFTASSDDEEDRKVPTKEDIVVIDMSDDGIEEDYHHHYQQQLHAMDGTTKGVGDHQQHGTNNQQSETSPAKEGSDSTVLSDHSYQRREQSSVSVVAADGDDADADADEVIAQTLEDDLCLDCMQFGNVGAFLRRANVASSAGPMFLRKLVYNSSRPDAAPKLALFAAHNIEPNTELLL